MLINGQTHKRRLKPHPATAVGVGNSWHLLLQCKLIWYTGQHLLAENWWSTGDIRRDGLYSNQCSYLQRRRLPVAGMARCGAAARWPRMERVAAAVLGSERRVLDGSRREGRRKVAAEIRPPDTASPSVCEHVFDVRWRWWWTFPHDNHTCRPPPRVYMINM